MADYLTHEELVRGLVKPGDKILQSLDPDKAHLIHRVMGICGEAGELLDAVKKHVIYGKPLDTGNVEEELGDLEFYMEGLRQGLGLDKAKILQGNIDKLSARYRNGYSDQAAIDRADKQGVSE